MKGLLHQPSLESTTGNQIFLSTNEPSSARIVTPSSTVSFPSVTPMTRTKTTTSPPDESHV